jgi:ribosomal protein S18 acetylase RimI-like enzyme
MATSDYQIRKASDKDSDAILGCLHTAFEPYRTQYTPQGFADTVLDFETIRRRMYDMCILVAVSGGRIVGTIGCVVKGREGHLRGMAVSPEWQGTGVAAALLHAAETELQNNGCRCVTLDTTAPLKRATRFYEKHGFSASIRESYNKIADAYARRYADELQHKPLDRELLSRFAISVKGRGEVCDLGVWSGSHSPLFVE